MDPLIAVFWVDNTSVWWIIQPKGHFQIHNEYNTPIVILGDI